MSLNQTGALAERCKASKYNTIQNRLLLSQLNTASHYHFEMRYTEICMRYTIGANGSSNKGSTLNK